MTDAIYQHKVRVRLLSAMAALMLLAACTADDIGGTGSNDTDLLQLSAYLQESAEPQPAFTRAAPAGYEKYYGPNTITIYPTETDGSTPSPSQFYYADGDWHSLVNVKKDKTYYIYGFMPSDIKADTITITPLSGDYSKGAMLTFKNLDPVAAADFCILTGLEGLTDRTTDDQVNVQRGQFTYVGKDKNKNYTNMMFDHLYAGIILNLKVGSIYSQLRTIRLKSVEMHVSTVYQIDSWNVTMQNDPAAAEPISYQSAPTINFIVPGDYVPLFTSENEDGERLATAEDIEAEPGRAIEANGYYLPYYRIYENLEVRCKYDVYDSKGNLIRRNCTATNKLPSEYLRLNRGERVKFNLTVEPTYLYVLSDPDLDNPTITIQAED